MVRRGRRSWACCPFHEEKHASFCLDLAKQRFTCYGCHAHGDAIDLYALRYGLSNRQAIMRLTEISGIKGLGRGRPNSTERAARHEEERKKAINQAIERSVQEARLECWETEGLMHTIIKHIKTERDLERPGPAWALTNLPYIEHLGDLFLKEPVEQLYALWGWRRWKERQKNGTKQ